MQIIITYTGLRVSLRQPEMLSGQYRFRYDICGRA